MRQKILSPILGLLALALPTRSLGDCQPALGPMQIGKLGDEVRSLVLPGGEPGAPHLATVLRDDRGEHLVALDPLEPSHVTPVDNFVKVAALTASHVIAVSPYSVGQLWAGSVTRPAARGTGASVPIWKARELRPELDAVSGAKGESWLATVARPLSVPARLGIFVGRVDAAGKLQGMQQVVPRPAVSVRLVKRVQSPGLALAWIELHGGDRYRVSSLWAAFLDDHGKLVGQPQRMDAVTGEQPLVNLVLVPSGAGVAVAWDPVVPAEKKRDRNDPVPIELRAFHVDPAAPPRLTRRERLTSPVWSVAGSAGGYLPNQVQGALVDGQPVLVWVDYSGPENRPPPWRAALMESPAPSVILTGAPALQPILRAGAKGGPAVLVAWDLNAGTYQRGALRCAPAPPQEPPPPDAPSTLISDPLPPLPADPLMLPLSQADGERAFASVLALLQKAAQTDPKAEQGAEALRKLGPDEHRVAIERLVDPQRRHEACYECVMAARTIDDLARCGWL